MNKFKFFGKKLSIRDPKTPYKKGKFVEESNSYKSRIGSKISENPITKSLLSIRRKVFQIENTLKSMFNFNKKTDDTKKRFQVVEKEEDRNTKKVAPQKSGLGKLIQRPKTGALDLIKNFVTFTFLGWLFTVLQPLIGKLEWLFPLLQGAFNFIGVTVKFLVDALGSFIKFGYDTKDKIDNLTKNVKDSAAGVKKKFDETLTAFQNVFGGAIELVNSFINVSASEDEIASAKQDLQEQSKDAIPPLPPLPNTDTNINQPKTSTFSTSLNVQGVNTGGIIRGYNEGGGIQNARIDPKTPITRGVEKPKNKKVFKPKPNIQTQKTRPGADVGGPEKVKEIYGERISIADYIPFLSFMRPDRKSGYHALLSTSEEYKKPKYDDILGIGNLMGASVDTALGQKPERKTYTQFADGIKYLVNYGISDPEGFEKLDIEQMIRQIVEPKFETALNKVRGEINKKVEEEGGDSPGGGGGGGLDGGIPGDEYGDPLASSSKDLPLLAAIAALESGSAQGQADVAQSVYNRLGDSITSKSGYGNTLRDVLLKDNQYQPAFIDPNSSSGFGAKTDPIFKKITDENSAIDAMASFYKKKGRGVSRAEIQKQYRSAVSAISNPKLQENARKHVGGRTEFKGYPVPGAVWRGSSSDNRFSSDYGSGKQMARGAVAPPPGLFDEHKQSNRSSVQAVSTGFRTGLKTGPEGRIGAGTEYHVDARFIKTLPLKDKIAMLDSMAFAHNQEGFVMEFSGRGVAGRRWNPNASYAEKERFAKLVLASHHKDRPPFQAFDYYIVKQSAKNRRHISAEGANIMAPMIRGGTYEYQVGGDMGRYLIIRDRNGKVIAKILHGDMGLPSPKQIGKIFKMDELDSSDQKLAKKGGKEGYINHKNQFVEQKWTAEQRSRFQEQTKKNDSEKTFTSNISTKPDTKVSQNQPQQTRLDVDKANEYADKLRKIKPGSGETLRIPGIGSFVAGRDLIGRPVEKYYNPNGNSISKEEFLNRVKNSTQKKKYGGLVYKNANTQTLPVEKYASYNDPMSSPQLIIQPIIVQTPISIKSTPNSTIIFSTPNVNSTDNSTQLMRS
jgi:hypothetical protein